MSKKSINSASRPCDLSSGTWLERQSTGTTHCRESNPGRSWDRGTRFLWTWWRFSGTSSQFPGTARQFAGSGCRVMFSQVGGCLAVTPSQASIRRPQVDPGRGLPSAVTRSPPGRRPAHRRRRCGSSGLDLDRACTPSGPVPPKARHDAAAPGLPAARVPRATVHRGQPCLCHWSGHGAAVVDAPRPPRRGTASPPGLRSNRPGTRRGSTAQSPGGRLAHPPRASAGSFTPCREGSAPPLPGHP